MTISTHTFHVEGMHCGSCALLIDDTVADLPGVHTTQTRVKTGLSTVELDLTHSRPEDVINAIEQLGYRASTAYLMFDHGPLPTSARGGGRLPGRRSAPAHTWLRIQRVRASRS